METTDNCLQNAMFLASTSYSGSSYDASSSAAIEDECGEPLAFRDPPAPSVLAA